jgi:hypothetical protein
MVLVLVVGVRLVEPRAHVSTSTPFDCTAANVEYRQHPELCDGQSGMAVAFCFCGEPVWAMGFAQMIGNVTAAISFYYAGRLIRRFGEYGLVVPTVLSPRADAKQSLIHREFTDEQRAMMGSLNSFAVCSFLPGALADRIGVIPALLSVIPMGRCVRIM